MKSLEKLSRWFADYPDDEKRFTFALLSRFLWDPLPMRVKRTMDILLFGIGPDLPIGARRVIGGGQVLRVFLVGVLTTMAACVVGTGVAAWSSGTLTGGDPNRLYLARDPWNIINYVVLCPLYVGLSAALLVTVARGEKAIADFAKRLREPESNAGFPRLPAWCVPALSFGIAALLTVQYIRESLSPEVYPRVGWWIERVTPDGVRQLGAVGIYYALLNFTMLLVCLLALLAFLSIAATSVSVARALAIRPVGKVVDWGSLERTMAPFVKAYLIAKLLTAVLMANAYTWKLERPRGSANIIALGAALTALGIFFVALPRYAIEYEWFRLKLLRARAAGETSPILSDDLRPRATRIIVNVMDALLIGGFAGTFFSGLNGVG